MEKENIQNGVSDDKNDQIKLKFRQLNEITQRSLKNPEQYWNEAAKKLTWTKKWDKIIDMSDAPITKWFTGGELNLCYNCIDRHVENGYGEQTAFIFESPVTKTKRTYTYKEIQHEVSQLAGVLRSMGVKKSNKVMIYTPVMTEGAVALLACFRLGALACPTPSGLPAHDLAQRIDHAKPKIILVASHGYHAEGWVNYKDIVDEACSICSHRPEKIVLLRRLGEVAMVEGKYVDWAEAVKNAKPVVECVAMEATEPLLVIYTSGSTGNPKGVVHAVGGFATRIANDIPLLFQDDSNREEIFFGTSNFGWIAGIVFNICFPLLSKNNSVIYEGDPLLNTNVHALYSLLHDNKVSRPFVRPGILKLLKSMDPEGEIAAHYHFDSIVQFIIAGERLDQSTMEWASKIFQTSLTNVYGQTEVTVCVSATPNISFAKKDRAIVRGTSIFPGWDVVIMKPDRTVAKPNEIGRILTRLPLPPGGLLTCLNDHDKCLSSYFADFPGYFDTKDEGYIDEEGALFVECRADDIMKHGTVYLPAQAVENVVLSHPAIAECVVISTPDLILKEIPVTLYIMKNALNAKRDPTTVSSEILQMVSKHFGRAVKFGKAIAVEDLPRTRTGKIHRSSVAALGKGQKSEFGGFLENPGILEDISRKLHAAGY